MKRLRFLTGKGNGKTTVPDGQILAVSMVPGLTDPAAGSYLAIGTNGPIFVPPGTTIDLQAADLGNCCGDGTCDRFPGDVQIVIVFGQEALGAIDGEPDPEVVGDPPASWLVIYNGC